MKYRVLICLILGLIIGLYQGHAYWRSETIAGVLGWNPIDAIGTDDFKAYLSWIMPTTIRYVIGGLVVGFLWQIATSTSKSKPE